MRPPGYEPGELPTAPHRDIINSFLNCSAKVQRLFPTPPNILSEICIYLTVIKQNSNKTYIKEAKTSKSKPDCSFQNNRALWKKNYFFKSFITFSKYL